MSIEKMADVLLSQALYYDASDLHITPRNKEYFVQMRINGNLYPMKKIPIKLGERLISHLKFLASMDISEKRKPQSGSLQSYFSGSLTSFRLSTLPTIHAKESIVIRILPQTPTLAYDQLSMFPTSTQILSKLSHHAHGLILFTGPTGSGKSTTMYALAEYCSKQLNRHVITLEDPVEKHYNDLLQIQINDKAGLDFQGGLKAILRHDPDVILIGEIRDKQTAVIAIRAAMTGHLVLSSLHTRNTIGAIDRLLEFGIKENELEQTLLAITAQRLVSVACPFCGAICSKYCTRPSVVKRTGIYEILSGSPLQQALMARQGEKHLVRFRTLKQMIRKGYALGYIPLEEYTKWASNEEDDFSRSRVNSNERR